MHLIDRVGNTIQVGSFIVYATKTEAPSLQFGWVEDIRPVKSRSNGRRVKVRHADHTGKPLFKMVFDYNAETKTGRYVDTDKPSTSWLETYSENDHRMLVIERFN